MAKITTFSPEEAGLPTVYDGHLTVEQIGIAARKLGGIDSDGYRGYEVARLGEGEWLVTFAPESPYSTEPYGEEGRRVVCEERGRLSFRVVHTELEPTPQ